MTLRRAAIFVLGLFSLMAPQASADAPVITTDKGAVVGAAAKLPDVVAYKGIPFAAGWSPEMDAADAGRGVENAPRG